MGVTVLVITHAMELVGNYCNRALVLNEGTKVFDGAIRELFNQGAFIIRKSLREALLALNF